MDQRPPLPPFETAVEKVKAENAWNTRDPAQVALAYRPTVFGETELNFWWAVRPSSLS
jgi:nuclear transport factor 2 (NTF2) superfamily protein